MIPVQIRDLATGEVFTRVGHNADEVLHSREPDKKGNPGKGPRRFVRYGHEPAGWTPPAKAAPPPEPDTTETDEDQILEDDDEGAEEDTGFVNVGTNAAPKRTATPRRKAKRRSARRAPAAPAEGTE